MNKTLAYKMVNSEVVLPEEMESLTIEPGADKVTLVTCTPYGVNDHRLLVHCVRTKYSKKDVDKQKSLAGRHWGKREFAVLIVVVAIVLLLLDIVIHAVRKRRKGQGLGIRHSARTTTMGDRHLWWSEASKPSQHSMKIAILAKSVECCDGFRCGRDGFRYGRYGFAAEPPARRPPAAAPRYVFAAFR